MQTSTVGVVISKPVTCVVLQIQQHTNMWAHSSLCIYNTISTLQHLVLQIQREHPFGIANSKNISRTLGAIFEVVIQLAHINSVCKFKQTKCCKLNTILQILQVATTIRLYRIISSLWNNIWYSKFKTTHTFQECEISKTTDVGNNHSQCVEFAIQGLLH